MCTESIKAKLEILKIYENHVVTVESRYMNAVFLCALLTVALGAWNALHEGFLIILLITIPVLSLFSIFSVAFYSRESAFMQGYIAAIEESINNEMGDSYFLYRSKIISEFYGLKHFLINKSFFPWFAFVLLAMNVYCFKVLHSTLTQYRICVWIFIVISAISAGIACFSIATNHKGRECVTTYVRTIMLLRN